MSFKGIVTNQITVGGETNFDTPTGTIMFWMRSSGLAIPAGKPATLIDRLAGTGGTGNGCIVAQNGDGTLQFYLTGGGTSTTTPVSNNLWHHVAVTFDQSASGLTIFYIDGVADYSMQLGAWSWQPGQEWELGFSHDTTPTPGWQPYNGLMDDVRFYNRALSASEIISAQGGALVDTTALVMQLNFTTAPGTGTTLTWQCPNSVLQSASSVLGPWTDVPGAASPYNISIPNTPTYYRYRTTHAPVVIITNPYLM
jgi:hypothetical protein